MKCPHCGKSFGMTPRITSDGAQYPSGMKTVECVVCHQPFETFARPSNKKKTCDKCVTKIKEKQALMANKGKQWLEESLKGVTYKSIADREGVSITTVSNRIGSEFRKKRRDEMEKQRCQQSP